MKKSIKLIFFEKKWDPNQRFLQSWKKLQVLEKKIFRKKNSFSLFVQIWSSKRCAVFFLTKWVSRYLSFGDFKVLHNKIINKTRSTKNPENSAHRFVDNCLTNHPAKFLQDRIKPGRDGALRVCTVCHFFKRKSLVRAFQPPLTFRVVRINNTH